MKLNVTAKRMTYLASKRVPLETLGTSLSWASFVKVVLYGDFVIYFIFPAQPQSPICRREAFWTEVANDSDLAKQFRPRNLGNMQSGNSPYAPEFEQVGGRERFELHHVESIEKGGAVYDADNLKVMTPKAHIESHKND